MMGLVPSESTGSSLAGAMATIAQLKERATFLAAHVYPWFTRLVYTSARNQAAAAYLAVFVLRCSFGYLFFQYCGTDEVILVMAKLIPALNSCRRMTLGERRFAQRLLEKLEDDYLCWYDVPVGPLSQHPDFVLLHPRRGVLIVEVKDWKLETIVDADKTSFTIRTARGRKVVANPLEQARQYAHAVSDELQRDPLLTVPDGDYRGRLCCPYGYGVVFTNIRRQAFDDSRLGEVLDPARVICQDEMTESTDAEAFQARLWGMFTVTFKTILSLPQIDRIRWHLFPQIRLGGEQLSFPDESPAKTLPDLLKVMDLQQEQLARSMGDGHRVIHGVAGSGKTMILGYRCEQLAPLLSKPVLVLCYNRALAAKLRDRLGAQSLEQRVNVRTFHAWCRDQLMLYNVELPASGPTFFDALADSVAAGLESGQIPKGQYGAVMVDEGHDFKQEWLRLVAQMVDPDTNSLLLLYDDAQSIYSGKRRKFTFSSVGVQARGRTTILRLNYRNTAEVLAVAYEFAKEFIAPEDAEEDGVPLVQPQSAGRHGPTPVLKAQSSLRQESKFLADQFGALNKEGQRWSDMAVLYRTRFMGEEVTKTLRAAHIPFQWLGESGELFKPNENSVKVMTMHGSKGLEFPVVGIPGLGYMPYADSDVKDEAKLLYVAMTRAMDTLLLTCHKETVFVSRLRKQAVAQWLT